MRAMNYCSINTAGVSQKPIKRLNVSSPPATPRRSKPSQLGGRGILIHHLLDNLLQLDILLITPL